MGETLTVTQSSTECWMPASCRYACAGEDTITGFRAEAKPPEEVALSIEEC